MRLVTLAVLGITASASAGEIVGSVEILGKKKPYKDRSNVVIYVEGVSVADSGASATMEMRKKQFAPRVVVVQKGSPVEFPNRDRIFHNVFSVAGENRFDLDLYKAPEVATKTFEHVGIVRVYCNIHPQMTGIVMVRDNPYFATSAKDGGFSIGGVPPGRYTVTAWHERAEPQSLDVDVPAQGQAGARFVLDASKYKRVRHKNKFGKTYKKTRKY